VRFYGRIAACAATASLLWTASPAAETSRSAEPRELGLHTSEQSRLFQVDLSIRGDPEVVRNLTAEDFKIKVGIHKLQDFHLDKHCRYGRDDPAPVNGEAAGRLATNPGSFVFYFDHPHLTQGGRVHSLEIAHDLVRRLIHDGNRGMILSNADRLVTYAGFTEDRNLLHDALARLATDTDQWSPWSINEQQRADEIVTALNNYRSIHRAADIARRHQQDDRRLTERNLNRLGQTLPRLAGLAAPKAVIYFADTLRMNAGAQYLTFFHPAVINAVSTLSAMRTDSLTGRIPFDRVVDEASANGVRFYTVQGAGLAYDVQRLGMTFQGMALAGDVPTVTSDFSRMAQDTLANLATETGGAVFLNGAPGDVIADRIEDDLACLYVVSFDPTPFSLDEPHRFLVKLKRKGAQVGSRGQVVFRSDSRKLTNRLLGAFTAPGSDDPEISVLESLIPLDYDRGEFKALVQVAVSGVPFAGARWDVGASLVDSRQNVSDASGRFTLPAPDTTLIFEKVMSFGPGPFQIVSVAHEQITGLVASREGSADWPRPDRHQATLGPVTIVQPVHAVFARNGSIRSTGSLALPRGRPLAPDLPAAMVSLVCTEKGHRRWDATRVERRLTGTGDIAFPVLKPDPVKDRCIQVRDVIPAHTLVSGEARYEIVLYREDREVASLSHEFRVGTTAAE